jgi:hypothetical protein
MAKAASRTAAYSSLGAQAEGLGHILTGIAYCSVMRIVIRTCRIKYKQRSAGSKGSLGGPEAVHGIAINSSTRPTCSMR